MANLGLKLVSVDWAYDNGPARSTRSNDRRINNASKDTHDSLVTSVTDASSTKKNSRKKRKAESVVVEAQRKSTRIAEKFPAVPESRMSDASKFNVSARSQVITKPVKTPSEARGIKKVIAPASTQHRCGDTEESGPVASKSQSPVRQTAYSEVSDNDSDLSTMEYHEMKQLELQINGFRGPALQPEERERSPKTPDTTATTRQVLRGLPTPTSTSRTHDAPDLKAGNKSLPTLSVVLKVPNSLLTENGSLGPAKPEVSHTGEISNATQKPALTSAQQSPTASKSARPNVGIGTPPAEQEELNREGLDIETLDLEAQIDPEQLRISRKLTVRSPIISKPAPQGLPEVWADSRQALCETVPYFKMPQSGCHQNDGHVYAFLYDGASRCREYMDTDLIIGGAGGGMEADSTGQLLQKKNHTMDEAQVKAVLNDIEHQNPLVVICGSKSEGAICKMPYRYNVLGWFKPVAVWAEKTMGRKNKIWTTIKYRFERLNQTKVAWYAPLVDDPLTPKEYQSVAPLTKQTCQICFNSHDQIYLVGWMCVNPSCEQFWKLPSGKDAPYGSLDYNPAFLLTRTEWAMETEPFSVRPPVLSVGHAVGDNLTHINTRGMCCPKCGRCNSRRLFRGWKCENAACDFENFPKHIPIRIPLLHQPWESTGTGPALARNKHDKAQGVQLSVDYKHGFKVNRYTVPGVNGALVHLIANTTINKLPGGADEMFDAMQRHDLHLERRRFGVEKMSSSKTEEKNQLPGADRTPTYVSRERFHPDTASPSDVKAMLSVATPLDKAAVMDENQTSDVLAGTKKLKTSGDEGPLPLPAGKKQTVEDGDFMTAFSMNYGMPYKFVASGASLPFKASPWPVRAARADLNWASKNFLDPAGHEDLNEELIFAYMEGQKLEYHDDGEEGLGPRIATLSLGGKAKMHLRIKMKHFVGCSKTGIFLKERPIPGSIAGTIDGVALSSQEMFARRLAAWEELQQLTDKKEYNKRAKEIPLELGLFEKRMKKADDLVTITLNHGDIVLMEGYDIQQRLEHRVVPEQCLRFALTCRTILPDHLKPEEYPWYGQEPDEEDMSALRRMATASDNAGAVVAM